jgi:hypothetical protein
MKKIYLFCFLSIYSSSLLATGKKAKEPERSVASQGRYLCDLKNIHTSSTTYPYAQVQNFLNHKCDTSMPFSVASGSPNSYLVCCVSN